MRRVSGRDPYRCLVSQFYELLDNGGSPDIPADASVGNGLVATGSSGAMILTGTEHGPVRVQLQIYAEQPPQATGWDEVVDVVQHTPSGTVSVNEPFGDPPPGIPIFSTTPDSWYRIRVHTRGRDQARQFVVGPPTPIEDHLIYLWPVPDPSDSSH